MNGAPPRRVAVVGAGWAGCAAAVTLAAAGVPVTLVEQAATLGGRARRVAHEGIALDNGQHLLVGAYRQTLALLEQVHGAAHAAALFRRIPLSLRPFGAAASGSPSFAAWRSPRPLDLALGVLCARGLGVRERLALAAGLDRLMRAELREADDRTVERFLAGTPERVSTGFWHPLCVAALNTPPDRASARMFANVVRATFAGAASTSDMLVPAFDLSSCFPDAAARFVAGRGGAVRHGVTARVRAPDAAGVTLALGDAAETFAAAIVAVAPQQLARALGDVVAREAACRAAVEATQAFAWESITTVYLGYAAPVRCALPLLRLDDRPGQWMFDRTSALGERGAGGARGLVAVVVSANGPHDALDHATLAREVDAQLRRQAPDLAALAWARVFAERRATYACTPALPRPRPGRIAPGLYLAGDYTDPDFPATLEAACRSGVAAARALLDDRAAARG